ncbi:ABC transporter permease [Curvivirga aplysinae]|uniref:ABC transporter permease n=1 Tax=Curvivirga aplysinae TaxID=2529852 RepID=UPI0012BC815A|nr:ABC transporter permease [Curvivirga aplysinae]MTI09288.1 ABC transporter permease [Curvivirga aplysinae]
MLQLIVNRCLQGLLTLVLASIIIFAATEILPGDVAEAILGQNRNDAAALEALREELGLNRPAIVRYFDWFFGILQGDLGVSLSTDRPIADMMSGRIWNTARLAIMTACVAIPLALILGLISAIRAGGVLDKSLAVTTLSLIAVPEFFIGLGLMTIFAVELKWLGANANIRPYYDFGRIVHAMALPVMTLGFAVLAHMLRMTRASVINIFTSPYIEMAVLKGIPKRRIVMRHALPNALSPIFAVIALNLAYMVSGVIIVETIFAVPGLSRLLIDGVALRDIPLIQACAMLFGAVYIVVNLLADIFSIIFNPRLRFPK